jgi:hypothetical protein
MRSGAFTIRWWEVYGTQPESDYAINGWIPTGSPDADEDTEATAAPTITIRPRTFGALAGCAIGIFPCGMLGICSRVTVHAFDYRFAPVAPTRLLRVHAT